MKARQEKNWVCLSLAAVWVILFGVVVMTQFIPSGAMWAFLIPGAVATALALGSVSLLWRIYGAEANPDLFIVSLSGVASGVAPALVWAASAGALGTMMFSGDASTIGDIVFGALIFMIPLFLPFASLICTVNVMTVIVTVCIRRSLVEDPAT